MYGDRITRSMQACLDETERRREKQLAYNAEHGITPQTIKKSMRSILDDIAEKDYVELPLVAEEEAAYRTPQELRKEIARVKKEMLQAAGDLDFEKAAELRDRMLMLEKRDLAVRD
jgi:excinuclease ABC subunit B